MKQANALDYDDMLVNFLRVLEATPAIAAATRHVLVDEVRIPRSFVSALTNLLPGILLRCWLAHISPRPLTPPPHLPPAT